MNKIREMLNQVNLQLNMLNKTNIFMNLILLYWPVYLLLTFDDSVKPQAKNILDLVFGVKNVKLYSPASYSNAIQQHHHRKFVWASPSTGHMWICISFHLYI